MIQINGYCPEPLDHISYDVSNALGLVTNLDAGVTSQFYDTNVWDFTTNYFECVDVPLTNGVNVVTLHATDLAGNVTTANFNYTVDYSTKTAPVVQLTMPLNGMNIAGNSFIVRGQVDDPTVTVTASITDANGDVNVVNGVVERTGRFWVENVPLNHGNNQLTLTASNVVGQTTVLNHINLVQSALTLTISPVADDSQLWQPTVSVGGTVSNPTYAVWVNGVAGVNNGDGTWSADNVPNTPGGVAIFDATAYPPSEAPPGSSSGTGVNPQTPNAANMTTDPDKPARLYVKNDTQIYHWTKNGQGADDLGDWSQDHALETYFHVWTDNVGGFAVWLSHYDGEDSEYDDFTMDATGIGTWNASEWPMVIPGTSTYTYVSASGQNRPVESE